MKLNPKTWTSKQRGIAALLSIPVVVAVVSLSTTSEDRARWAKEADDRAAQEAAAESAEFCSNENAVYASWTAVKETLNDPSSAEFPPPSEAQVATDSTGHIWVVSWVSATNAFGARVRSNYVAAVSCDGTLKKWHLEKIQVGN